MTTQKRSYEIIIGLSFIVATLCYSTGSNLITNSIAHSQINTTTYLGIFLELINSTAVLVIGILISKLLKVKHKALSQTYLAARVFEALILGIGALSPFFTTNKSLVNTIRQISFNTGMISLSLVSLWLCYSLFQHHYVHSSLALTGLVGYLTLGVYAMLTLIGYPANTLLFLPGAVFEIAFPIYLMVKGMKI